MCSDYINFCGGGAILIAFYFTPPMILMRYVLGIVGLSIIIIYGFIREKFELNIFSKSLKWIGALSFEIYVIHIFIINVVNYLDLWSFLPTVAWYILFLLIPILFAFILSLETKLIYKHMEDVYAKRKIGYRDYNG
jgi:peptidoglycan/LPS O-acetylase OafA/YrhL